MISPFMPLMPALVGFGLLFIGAHTVSRRQYWTGAGAIMLGLAVLGLAILWARNEYLQFLAQ
jgi:hypothetical protein